MRDESPAVVGLFLGAGVTGLLGGMAGFIVGLLVYAPTAWAAAFELGIPAAVIGGLSGACWGLVKASRTRNSGYDHRHAS